METSVVLSTSVQKSIGRRENGSEIHWTQRRRRRRRREKRERAMEIIFGNPRYQTVRPPLQLSISTAYIVDICEAFIDLLRSAKVTITETDLLNLVTVTVMQVEAKVWFSQQGSFFATYNEEVERAIRVKAVLPEALYPISIFIDQIGKFEMEQQIFIPTIHDLHYQGIGAYAARLGVAVVPPGTIELPAGNALTGDRQWVQIVNEEAGVKAGVLVRNGVQVFLAPAFIANPNGFEWSGMIQLHPYQDVLPAFETIVSQYYKLIGRVNYRFRNALAKVDYSQARGTEAQLVTSQNNNDTSVLVWSNRYIDNGMLTCGAMLRFGHGLRDLDDAHTYEHRCVQADVEMAGSLRRFVGNITNRFR